MIGIWRIPQFNIQYKECHNYVKTYLKDAFQTLLSRYLWIISLKKSPTLTTPSIPLLLIQKSKTFELHDNNTSLKTRHTSVATDKVLIDKTKNGNQSILSKDRGKWGMQNMPERARSSYVMRFSKNHASKREESEMAWRPITYAER